MRINYENKTIEDAIIEFNQLSIVEQAKETNEILEDYLKKSREDILTKRKETNKTIRINKLNSFQISIGSDINEVLKKIEDIRLNEIKPRNEKLSQIESDIIEKQKKNKISKDSLDSKLRTTASKIKNFKNPSVVVGNKYNIRGHL